MGMKIVGSIFGFNQIKEVKSKDKTKERKQEEKKQKVKK